MKKFMENLLKFTGKFKNLKKLGYTFQRLYARNYKCYWKPIYDTHDNDRFWVWVGHGGYIEYNDLYSNTKNFIDALHNIDWGKFPNTNYVKIQFNNRNPNDGYLITDKSFDMQELSILYKRYGLNYTDDQYDLVNKEVRSKFNDEIMVTKESANKILDVYNQLQNS